MCLDVPEVDEETAALHWKYYEETEKWVDDHRDWVESKSYETDGNLSSQEADALAKQARERLFRWPQLHEQDKHRVDVGSEAQRFCQDDGEALGDPGGNVFIVNLPRRPSRRHHAMEQLKQAGISATVVAAVDGDAILQEDDLNSLNVQAVPSYACHVTTGEVGCFMSHYTIWHHMVENGISSAMILEDDFDFQANFAVRLGQYLQEARGEDWNFIFLGRDPKEKDVRRVSEHVLEPGYSTWTVGYILRLSAARALLEAHSERALVAVDHYFNWAMGRKMDGWAHPFAVENSQDWGQHIPVILRPLAFSPPLVHPFAGSNFLSDTAMRRSATRKVQHLGGIPPLAQFLMQMEALKANGTEQQPDMAKVLATLMENMR
eukprot:gnl/MRDRNA2_/MRDRNA2_211144_c0_seq1.p1 gnl/MRDRNA2_/MRDRNA2_211144_c0~~gnl/MRDRNA2_/MRDRNA2_211144_c0_seq1.p1  ORF type:complete len:377 (-),score=70.78 gnl/MRDRNA2_/MRDRNA2_211144_c0_seq1:79-1209(-)